MIYFKVYKVVADISSDAEYSSVDMTNICCFR